MPEQNLQFDLKHSATVVYSAPVAKYRFVSWAGAHATAAEQVQGISELAGPAGGAGSVVTSYSFPVEAAAAIPAGSAVAPSGDGTGRAVVATGLQCGRALTAAAAAGDLVTVRVQLVAGGLAPAKQAASDALVSGAWNGGGYDPIGAQITAASGTIVSQSAAAYTATDVTTPDGPGVRYLGTVADRYLEVSFALPRPMTIQQVVALVQASAPAMGTMAAYAGTDSAYTTFLSKGVNVGASSGINGHQSNGVMCPITFGQDPSNSWTNASGLNLNTTLFTHVKIRGTPASGQMVDFTLAKVLVNPKAKCRLAITIDDGYTDVFTRFLPLLEARGLKASLAIIPSMIGAAGYLSVADLQQIERNGHEVITHGPFVNSGGGSLTSNHATDAAAVADAVLCRQTLIDLGFLRTPAQRATYVWPQGVFQRTAGHTGLLDAMLEAGFTNCRSVTRYLSDSRTLALATRYGKMLAPIAGHIRSSVSAADEDTVCTNTKTAMTYAANNGLDTSLMFHKIIADQGTFAATSNNDIEVSRFVDILDHGVSLIAAGKAENVLFSRFAGI